MGCCKDKKESFKEIVEAEIVPEKNLLVKAKNYTLKTVLFLVLTVVVIPVLIPVAVVVLFRMVVLSKNINLLPLIQYLAEKLFTKEEDEEEDEEEDLDEDDYELENPEEIIVLNQN